jgi:type IV pilus assembly protein PilB
MPSESTALRAVETVEQPQGFVGANGVRPPTRRGGAPRSLTEVIVELNLCSREQVLEAIEIAAASGSTADRVLLERGAISPEGVAVALAERHGLDYVDLGVFNVDMAAAQPRHEPGRQAPRRAADRQFAGDRALLVAMSDPANVHAVDDIAILTGYEVRVAVATSEDIANVIARLARVGDVVTRPTSRARSRNSEASVVDLHETADDAPVVKLGHQLVGQAVEQGASDLHLTPDGEELRVRFRVDGVLRDVTTVPRRMAAGVVSRMKIMAELDIAERRVPQDGRVGLTVDGRRVDLRVVTVPTSAARAS